LLVPQVGQPETNPLLTKLWAQRWANASPEERADLVARRVVTPEGVYLHQPHRSGLSDLGHAVGGALKFAAPIAALAIPGLGPVAAAALAGGGNLAGQALTGHRVNLGEAALAGGGAYVGRGGLSGKQPLGAATGGTPSNLSGLEALYGDAPAMAGGGGGILSQAGNYIVHHPGDAARLGLGALGAIQGSKQQGKADQLIGRALAPLNQPNPYADLNLASYGNPYSQPAQMSGRQSLRRELMR
jgi:hypothetical protein